VVAALGEGNAKEKVGLLCSAADVVLAVLVAEDGSSR